MKIYRLLLLIPVLALSGCGNDDPKKPVSNPSVSVTSMTSSLTSGSTYYRALSLDEVTDAFEKVSEHIKDSQSIKVNLSESDYETIDEEIRVTSYALESNIRLFSNSIVHAAYNADRSEDYKNFGFYNEEYGSLVEKYEYIDNNFEYINTVNVYTKIGEANKKNILSQSPYSIALCDNTFNLGKNIYLINPLSESVHISLAAELSNGNYEIRFKYDSSSEEKQIISTHTYLIQDGYLLSWSYRYERNKIISEEEKAPENVYAYRYEISYSSNGDFDRASLPEVSL